MTSFTEEAYFEELLAQTRVKELALQLTALRCLTNLFSSVHGCEFMYSRLALVSSAVVPWGGLVSPPNRNVQLAYATLWLNYSVMVGEKLVGKDGGADRLVETLLSSVLEADRLGCGEEKEALLSGEAAATMMNVFGNLLAAPGGDAWREARAEVLKEHLKKVQTYPKTFGEAGGVRSALVHINRLV